MRHLSLVAQPVNSTPLATAAAVLFRQELALHDAHQTQVPEWIHAAENRLHAAVVQYEALRAA